MSTVTTSPADARPLFELHAVQSRPLFATIKRWRWDRMLMLGAVCFLLASYVVKYPDFVWHGEPAYETATNYFLNAYQKGLWENLKTTDVGYLVLLPRLIAVFIVQVLRCKTEFFQVTFGVSAGFLIFFATFFIRRNFRTLLSSDAARFVTALLIGEFFFLRGYPGDFHYFHNFASTGVLFCLLMLFVDFESAGRRRWLGMTALTFLLGASKPHYLAFLPLYGCGVAYSMWRGRKWTAAFQAICCGSFLLQGLSIYMHRGIGVSSNAIANYGLLRLGLDTVLTWLSTYLTFFVNLQVVAPSPMVARCLYGLTAVLILVVGWMLSRRDRRLLALFVAANVAALVCIAITLKSVTVYDYIQRFLTWDRVIEVRNSRHFLFSDVLICFGAIVALAGLARQNKHKLLVTCMAALALINSNGYSRNMYYDDPRHLVRVRQAPMEQTFSQWNVYKKLLREQDFFIPINNYPWVMAQGNEYLSADRLDWPEASRLLIADLTTVPQSAQWQLRGLMIVHQRRVDAAGTTGELTPGSVVRQRIRAENNCLQGFACFFAWDKVPIRDVLHVRVLAEETGQVITEQDLHTQSLSQNIIIDFPAVRDSAGKWFVLEVESRSGVPGKACVLHTRPTIRAGETSLAVNERPLPDRELILEANYGKVRVAAHDATGRFLGFAEQLTPTGYDYTYLLFPGKIRGATHLRFLDETDNPRTVFPRIRYFGSKAPAAN